MKKLLTILMSVFLIVHATFFLTGCDVLNDALDDMIEVELLREENSSLKSLVDQLQQKITRLEFDKQYPNRIITSDYVIDDMDIHMMSSEFDDWSNSTIWAIFVKDSNVTINDGVFDAGTGAAYNIALWADGESKVTINDGIFITGDDVNGDVNHCIYASNGAIVEINGGTFISKGDASWLINCRDNDGSVIIISGGTFIGFNPQNCICEGEMTNFLAEGYTVEETIVNNVTNYKVVKQSVDQNTTQE